MAIFRLAPDQTIAQMWSNGVWGAKPHSCLWLVSVPQLMGSVMPRS